jgi:hypothetical protein
MKGRKVVLMGLLAGVFAAAALVLAGCEPSFKSSGGTGTGGNEYTRALVGKWQHREEYEGMIIVEFTNTTITFSSSVEGGEMPEGYPGPETFPYTATDTTITITYNERDEGTDMIEYSIDGDSLTMISAYDNEDGETITDKTTYTKV